MAEYEDRRIFDSIKTGLYFIRNEYGVWTNIPHVVAHHSPAGYEWGYGGSGPADLALNICENLLKHLGYSGPRVACWKGDCYQLAWAIHQAFKWQFIASMPEHGAVIPFGVVAEWIKVRVPQAS